MKHPSNLCMMLVAVWVFIAFAIIPAANDVTEQVNKSNYVKTGEFDNDN